MESHYTPNFARTETPIAEAVRILESDMQRYGIHTIYEGRNVVGGVDLGPAVVAVVADKGPRAQSRRIPSAIVTSSGLSIPTDVVQESAPHTMQLPVPDLPDFRGFASNDWQRCQNCPVPGGVQIAPQGAQWVGTLGAAVKFGDKFGAITNAHVSGFDGVGKQCRQPHSQAGWIGTFVRVSEIRFNNVTNYIDAALIDTLRTDGPFAPGTHTVVPTQFNLGRINPSVKPPAVGDIVRKSGRTTGVTRGRIVGINATSNVGYDQGTARFQNQVVIQGIGGEFSAGGDSGSLILSEDLRPVCLLFAGGGGQTIANPIAYVLDWAKAEFF